MTNETPSIRQRKERAQRLKDVVLAQYPDVATAARDRGWTTRTLQAHLSGNKDIGRKSLEKYAKSLGINFEWLMTGRNQSEKILNSTPQPPLNYRYVPLLAAKDISQATNKTELAAIEPETTELVRVDNNLGAEVRVFEVSDNAMVSPIPDPDRNLRRGEKVVVDLKERIDPGVYVTAVLFNPTRIVHRVYGIAKDYDPASRQPRNIIKLTALSPHFPEETIASPNDGFVAGLIVRVQSIRELKWN